MLKKTQLAVAISAVISLSTLADTNLYTVDEVLVTATRSEQSIQNTAASVDVITDKDIEENLTSDVDNLFDYVPGVNIEGNQRQGIQSVNVRGVGGNRVKILVDGVSQPNRFDSGYSFLNSGRVDLDVDMLKSTEIVKGAASSLHGSDAIGGVVAFQTKDPSDFLKDDKTTGGHVKLGYSSSDKKYTSSIALASRVGDLDSLVAFTLKDGEGHKLAGKTKSQDKKAKNLLVKLQYFLNDDHMIEFNGKYNQKDINTVKKNHYLFKPYKSDDISKVHTVGIKHTWESNTIFADTLTWRLDYLSKSEKGITKRTCSKDSFFGCFGQPPGNNQKKIYTYKDKGYQAEVQLDKVVVIDDVEHEFIYGVSLSSKKIKNLNDEYNLLRKNKKIYYVPDAKEKKYGFFIQDTVTFDKLVLTPGIRFDSFSTNPSSSNDLSKKYKKFSDSAITGRLGALYSLNENHKIFTQVSQGFRAPDFKELFYSYGNPSYGYVSKPNFDLKSEKSISYELGWRHNNDMASTEVSVFYSDYDDFIENRMITNKSTGILEGSNYNVAKAKIKGIEFSNSTDLSKLFSIPEGFSSKIAASYTDGEDGKGNALNSVMPWSGVVGLEYDHNNVWGVGAKVVYTAKKSKGDVSNYAKGSILPGSSTVIDLTAFYKPVVDLTLRAGIFNLTDKKYYSWSDVRGLMKNDENLDSHAKPERNFGITAKYEF